MKRKLNLSGKLGVGFGLILAALIAVGAVGYIYLGQVRTMVLDLSGTHLPLLQAVSEIDAALTGQELEVAKYTIHREERFLAEYQKLDNVVNQALARLKKLVSADDDLVKRGWLDQVNIMAAQHDALFAAASTALIAAIKDKQPQTVLDPLADKLEADAAKVMKLVDAFLAENNREAERVSRLAEHAVELASRIIVIVGLSTLIVGMLSAYFISRGITRPINRAVEGLTAGSQQVASASRQIASAGQSLAESSSEQAASLEEAASSLEELASMTNQNAENARQADGMMKEARRIVQKANASMKRIHETMGAIEAASDKTVNIIKTIDEIAFQTNLLALNAAVEAARAGEAGAGFAVVADEVRNLAMRAAEAAKNTSALIEANIKDIGEGSSLVAATDQEFAAIQESVGKVGELVAEISAASVEQSQGIEQINQAASQMGKVTQQVAANAEEAAASSEELSAQAETMMGQVAELDSLVTGARQGQAESSPSEGFDHAGRLLPDPETYRDSE